MRLSKQGDIYFPGSSDYMEKAKREGDVFADSEKVIVYLVSAINVTKGNPRHPYAEGSDEAWSPYRHRQSRNRLCRRIRR